MRSPSPLTPQLVGFDGFANQRVFLLKEYSPLAVKKLAETRAAGPHRHSAPVATTPPFARQIL
ncbi:hypothetical protein O5833_30015, partial [Escherichia coli]|nr:hypothetical protein [Escherichia coli]